MRRLKGYTINQDHQEWASKQTPASLRSSARVDRRDYHRTWLSHSHGGEGDPKQYRLAGRQLNFEKPGDINYHNNKQTYRDSQGDLSHTSLWKWLIGQFHGGGGNGLAAKEGTDSKI